MVLRAGGDRGHQAPDGRGRKAVGPGQAPDSTLRDALLSAVPLSS